MECSIMECSEILYKAMVAFCRQHAKMQGEMNVFGSTKPKPGTQRLKAKNAFWHEFAENPELPGTYHGSDR